MPTDAYRSWVAAHPSLDALTDEQKDHEAALAMGWRLSLDVSRTLKRPESYSCYPKWIDPDGYTHERAPAKAHACLAAMRGALEDDDDR